jgi:tetratricopeptide (TPR) repeat protein
VVFLFRKDAKEYYQLADDQKVLRRALELYRKATKLAPDDFSLATHLAQTYYYLKAEPASDPAAAKEAEKKLYEEAVAAWLEAQKLAREDSERQGVAIHLARISLNCGRTTEARRYLETVNHPTLQVLKERNVGRLERMEKGQAEPDEKAD